MKDQSRVTSNIRLFILLHISVDKIVAVKDFEGVEFIWPFSYINYLNQSSNQNDSVTGRYQGLFPPISKAREKRLGDEVEQLLEWMTVLIVLERQNIDRMVKRFWQLC